MSQPSTRLDEDVRAALEATGLPWIVKIGGRHRKVILAGRMVGILPIASNGGEPMSRARMNLLAQIRRAAREVGQ
jgi:hypothetical protein